MRALWRRVGPGARIVRLACGATVVVLAVAACSTGSASSEDTRFGADTPSDNACRVLTASDIAPASNNTPTVSCSSPHTAVTIFVGEFAAADVTNAKLTNGSLGNEALQRCTAAWKRTVGGDATAQHISVVALAYYLPDTDQLSKGARWYRCDLVIGGQDGMALKDLPLNVTGLLNGTLPDSLLACRTAPDFKTGHEISCDGPHVLRAVGTAKLPDQTAYPGDTVLKTASAKGCLPVVKQWLHGRVDGGIAYQWPDEVSWQLLGDHTAVCWTVTIS